MQLTALQKERDRRIKETEEMQRMLCELEDQRNQLANEADELKNEVSESMSRSMNASLAAEREGKQVEVLRHETETLRRHLSSSVKLGKENEMLQLELRIAVDRNAKLETDLKSEHQHLAKTKDDLEYVSAEMQQLRQQNAVQAQEIRATSEKLQEAAGRAAEQALRGENTAVQLQLSQEQLDATAKRLAVTLVDLDKLQVQHTALAERCETLQREVVWRDQETDRRGQELQQARMSLDALASTNKHLDMDLAACRALIEKMDAQKRVDESFRAKLQEDLDTAVTSNTQLQHNLANAKDGNNNLLDRVSVLTSELKARGQEVQDVRQQAAAQERELLEVYALSERLKREISVRDASFQEVSDHAARLAESQAQMKTEMAKMRGEKDHLLTQALSDAEVRGGLEACIKSLDNEVAAVKFSNERLLLEVQSKDKSLTKLADSRANLDSKVSELQTIVAEKEMEVVDRDRQLTVAHNRILGLEARMRDADTKSREAGLCMCPCLCLLSSCIVRVSCRSSARIFKKACVCQMSRHGSATSARSDLEPTLMYSKTLTRHALAS
jgi:chromosome segregation ATPase